MGIGERIRKIRLEFGLSQDELSRKIGVTPQTIYRWERSKTTPRPDNLKELAKFFKIDIDWFYTEDKKANEPKIPPDILEAVKDKRIQKMVRLLRSILDVEE